MEDITILELEAQIKKLLKQMTQVKKAMKFDGISLDPITYLSWMQALEDYFHEIGCYGEESFMTVA